MKGQGEGKGRWVRTQTTASPVIGDNTAYLSTSCLQEDATGPRTDPPPKVTPPLPSSSRSPRVGQGQQGRNSALERFEPCDCDVPVRSYWYLTRRCCISIAMQAAEMRTPLTTPTAPRGHGRRFLCFARSREKVALIQTRVGPDPLLPLFRNMRLLVQLGTGLY